jgi:hypothetical protein
MPFASSYEPVEAGGTTFHELVGGRSERIAVVDEPAELTYATPVPRSRSQRSSGGRTSAAARSRSPSWSLSASWTARR